MSAEESKDGKSDEDKKSERKADESYKKFMGAAGTSRDEVTMVLRSHLLAEYYIDHIIISNIPRGDILVDGRFTFAQKLKIIEALNILRKEALDSVNCLNAVRNACAHNMDYQITEADVDRVGRPFGKQYLKVKAEHFESVKSLLHWTLALPIISLTVVAQTV